MNNFEPRPCRHCGGFCGDSGPTCDERYDAAWSGEKTVQNNQSAQTMPDSMKIAERAQEILGETPDRERIAIRLAQLEFAALSQTAGVAEAVRSYLMSNDLYSLLTDIQNGIDSPATMGTANSLIIRLDRLREMLAAAPAAQQTAGVVLARGWFHALPDEDDYEFHDDASGAGKNCDGCIRAMIVAAPAASGGESHPDALQDGTLSKSTAKRVEALAASSGEDYSACCDTPAYCSSVRRCTAKDSRQPPAAASVSERARALLADAWLADTRDAKEADHIRSGPLNHTQRIAVAAIEQALTQQRVCATCGGRGEIGGHVGQTAETFDYVTEPCPECTTPQPSADAVREVIGSMRNFADVADKCELTEGNAQVAIRAWVTQLETLLSGGSHA